MRERRSEVTYDGFTFDLGGYIPVPYDGVDPAALDGLQARVRDACLVARAAQAAAYVQRLVTTRR